MATQRPPLVELRAMAFQMDEIINRVLWPSATAPVDHSLDNRSTSPMTVDDFYPSEPTSLMLAEFKNMARDKILNDEWLSDEIVHNLANSLRCWEADDTVLNPLWATKTDAFERGVWPRALKPRHRRVFIPMVDGVHWRLAVLDVQGHRIDHYDSMRPTKTAGTDDTESARRDEIRFKEFQDARSDKHFKFQEIDCTQQNDGHSCGLFVLAYIKALVSDKDVENIDIQQEKKFWLDQIEKMEGPLI